MECKFDNKEKRATQDKVNFFFNSISSGVKSEYTEYQYPEFKILQIEQNLPRNFVVDNNKTNCLKKEVEEKQTQDEVNSNLFSSDIVKDEYFEEQSNEFDTSKIEQKCNKNDFTSKVYNLETKYNCTFNTKTNQLDCNLFVKKEVKDVKVQDDVSSDSNLICSDIVKTEYFVENSSNEYETCKIKTLKSNKKNLFVTFVKKSSVEIRI